MQHKYRSLNRFLSVILIVSITLMNTNIALADDSSPPEPTPTFESTEQPIDPTVSTTETTVVETPPIEETPTVVEPTATSEPIFEPTASSELPTEPPVGATQIPTETPVVEENSAPVEQAPITELLSQAPENTDLVVLDENGQALSLTSQEALDTILDTDPMWCPAGVLPGGVGCSANFATIAALLTSMRTTPSNYSQDGVIYFTTTPGASFSLTNSATSLGSSGFTTLSTFNLTLQGGWNGLNGASATFAGQTNFGSNTLTVGTVANPWVGSITLTNFTFSGVSSSNAVTVYTNAGNITLNNVDVAQQSGNNYTALLTSNSGNITVQNGSSFDGNNSGANQNRGFRAQTTTGSITITGASGSPITFTDAKGCLVVFVCLVDTVVNYNGASLYAPNVTLNYVTANNNDLNGIEIFNANSVILNNVVSTNNGTNILLLPDQFDVGSGVYVNGTGSTLVLVNGGTFSNNERYGLEIINGTMDFVVNPTCNANQLGCTNDTTPPVLGLPANMTVEATGPSGAAVAYSATADDNLWGSVTVTCGPASGSTFPLGITTVNCSASDPEGNTANGSFTVTVQDTTGPVIDPHPDITVEATSPAGAIVTYASPPTSDAVDGPGVATCSPASGSTFPVGDTTVTCSATDTAGNAATPTTFVVHVVDTTPPVIDPHLDVTAEATSSAGAVVDYISPATSDIVDGPGVATCSPTSGNLFPLGDTIITCNATDSHGNVAIPTTFVIHVVDTTSPIIDPLPDINVEATSPAGATVTYTSPATSDAVDGQGVATCTPASGITFPVGDTTVTCNATDSAGNAATPTTFVVHVVDTIAPIIAPHGDITAETVSSAGVIVNYTLPTTSDAVDGPGVATCSPAPLSTFPIGDTTVTCNATDSHGNAATPTTFVVHVVDTIAPVIEYHADETAEAASASGAVVNYTSPATSDAGDGSGVATCTPAPGIFPLGNTTVTCNAIDANGNSATPTTFVVHVVDTTAPVIAAHTDVTIEATSPSGATVNYTRPGTLDAVDGSGTASCSPAPGNVFPLGNTTVTCNATDSHGNTATSTSFVVRVVDTTGPVIHPHADVTVTIDNTLGTISTYSPPSTLDTVDGQGVATCTPVSGSFFPLGDTLITCNAIDSLGHAATPITFTIHVKYKPLTDRDTRPQGTNLSVPVTGGLLDLDCLTIVDSFGIKVTFHNLCDYQAAIADVQADTLPSPLPSEYSFVQGLNVLVLFEQQVVKDLPTGAGVQLDFPVPANTQDQFAVLLWDDQDGDGKGEWLDVTQLIKDQELSKVLSADPNDELYELIPTKTLEAFYRVITTEKTGTFVLVKK